MKLDEKTSFRGTPNPVSRSVFLACLAMAGGLSATGATAQQATPQGTTNAVAEIEQIVVTARKRSEKLLDVPISITAISEKEIRASGTSDLYDVAASSGFTFNQYNANSAGGRQGSQITFRGLQGATSLAHDASGSLFVDGIFISSAQSSVDTTDVARIEVMKGPQNAYFGRSTFGGAVNYVTKNPSDTFKGQANLTVNNRGSTDLDLSVEGPLKEDVLKGRLVINNRNKRAFYHATDGGDLGAEKNTGVTGTLFLTPNDSSWYRLRGHYHEVDDSAAASAYLSASRIGDNSCSTFTQHGYDINHNPISYTPGVRYFCGGLPAFDSKYLDANTVLPTQFASVWQNNSLNLPFLSDVPTLEHSGLRRNVARLSFQGGYELPNKMELVFNMGYNKMDSVAAWDLDRSSVNNFFSIYANRTSDVTLDARLSSDKSKSVRWLVGVSRYRGKEQSAQADWILAGPAMTANRNNFSNWIATVPAIYGSIDVDVTKDITLIAEARQQTDKIVSKNFAGTVEVTSEKTNFLPRLTAKYRHSEATSLYASYAEGVQPLSTNGGYTNASAAGKAFLQSMFPGINDYTQQPKIKTTELGVKQRLFGNRLQYSAAVYDQKWTNRSTLAQIFNPATCPPNGPLTAACPFSTAGASVFVPNDAKIQGFEFSGDVVLTPRWTAGLNLTYTKTKWTKFYGASTSSLTNPNVLNKNAFYFEGSEIAKIPAWQWSANTTYRIPGLIEGMDGYVRGDFIYNGAAWDAEPNYTKRPGYLLTHLRAGVEKKNATIELFVKNLFDDRHWTYAARSTDLSIVPFSQQGVIALMPEPRTVGIRTSLKF